MDVQGGSHAPTQGAHTYTKLPSTHPCAAKSIESCDKKVVFPAPVGPVRTVISPFRKPLSREVSPGKARLRTPSYLCVLVLFWGGDGF